MKRRLIFAALFAPAVVLGQQSTFTTCMESYAVVDPMKPLAGKIILSGPSGAPPFAMLTDQAKPTEEEKTALAAFAENYSNCYRQDAPYLDRMPPDARAITEATVNGVIALAASLYTGELTYGQFNKERAERSNRYRAAMQEMAQRHQQRAAAEDQGRRNAVLQYLLSQPRPIYTAPSVQPYQIPIQPSVTTNCFRFGNQVTCTSR